MGIPGAPHAQRRESAGRGLSRGPDAQLDGFATASTTGGPRGRAGLAGAAGRGTGQRARSGHPGDRRPGPGQIEPGLGDARSARPQLAAFRDVLQPLLPEQRLLPGGGRLPPADRKRSGGRLDRRLCQRPRAQPVRERRLTRRLRARTAQRADQGGGSGLVVAPTADRWPCGGRGGGRPLGRPVHARLAGIPVEALFVSAAPAGDDRPSRIPTGVPP